MTRVLRSRVVPGTVAALAFVTVGIAGVLPLAASAVAGLLVLLLCAPVWRRLADSAAWALPVLVGVAALLVDVGGWTLAPGPWRYAAAAAVTATIVLLGAHADDRSRAFRVTAVVLFCYGLVGTLYGRWVLETENGTLPLIGPLVIACLPPVRNWSASPDPRRGLRALALVCTAFAVASGLSRLGFLPESQVDVLNHEKAFLVVMGVAAAVAARDRVLVAAALGAAVLAFAAYPAATYVVAALAAVGTLVLVRWSPLAGVRCLLAAAAMAGTAAAVVFVDRLIGLSNVYFELVGKIDNGDTREALYRAALERLDDPLFSAFFTGDITVVGELSGTARVVPVHNDYLSVTLGGGVVAGALLLGLFLFANGLALRAVVASDDVWQRRAIVVLLIGINAAAVSAFANPVFMNPGSSAVTYALVAGLLGVCRSPGAPGPRHGNGRAPTAFSGDGPTSRRAASPSTLAR